MDTLTSQQLDRACGAVLASAAGDALGAPYEFGCAEVGADGPQMIGGGLGRFAPGEWTDDTAMAWCVLEGGVDLDRVARNFKSWWESRPSDIGNQTRAVLSTSEPTAAAMTAVAADLHARTGHTAGNGSLMRTAAVALPYLDDPRAVAEAAADVSALTHFDPRAQQACVLWSLAIRHAVLHAEFDLRAGLAHLEPADAQYWTERIDEAEAGPPERFHHNGWTVTALQAAWSAIMHTPVPDPACRHLQDGLVRAIGIGGDTDTVGAIAGALLGARWGASAVPAKWRRVLHGYRNTTGDGLVELAHLAAAQKPNHYGWPGTAFIDYSDLRFGDPVLVHHPHDAGVWLADAGSLQNTPEDVTAVVSLCLVGSRQVPDGLEHITFRLLDLADPAANPNLDFLLSDAAQTVCDLRDEGQVVLLHCVAAHSRTPTVAAAYSMLRGVPRDRALADILGVLPSARPNAAFSDCLKRFGSMDA